MTGVLQDFVSVGVNRVVNALDWSSDGTVAFGAHNMVAVYDAKAAEITSTLVGHTGVVNCVDWVNRDVAKLLGADEELLVSGSADGTLRVWAVSKGGRAAVSPWEQVAVLEGHTAPVTAVALTSDPTNPSGNSIIMVSTAGDTALHVWSCEPAGAETGYRQYSQPAWKLLQRIEVGTQVQHAVALSHLPGSPGWLVLATGGTDSRITLYTRPPQAAADFSAAAHLSGHENWVRSLAFVTVAGAPGSGCDELLLASASQDRYGRIWRICEEGAQPLAGAGGPNSQGQESEEALMREIMRYAPRPTIRATNRSYTAMLESLLIGHEDWVHSCKWQPHAHVSGGSGSPTRQDLCLLTTSMDRTMVLWVFEPSAALWMNVVSVGDAGASCLGYFGGVFNPDASHIMAHGFTGALHLWERQAPAPGRAGHAHAHHTSWAPRHALGGHFRPVADVAWGVDGGCVMTVSEDQTARIFSSVVVDAEGQATASSNGQQHWCEIARPQIHGHDFSCLAVIPGGTKDASYSYACGSEEKVLRIMEVTQAFLDTLDMVRGQAPGTGGGSTRRARAFGAAVAALGLTNKAVLEGVPEDAVNNAGVGSGMPGGGYDDGPDFAPNAAPAAVAGPPLEEHLAQNTLWPEAHKLYGHGDMIYCCAASPDGAYLASACVAKVAAAASIWIWDVRGGTWKGVAQLQAHTLTVTQLAWSHCGRYLAACSRDRSFSLFQRSAPAAGAAGGLQAVDTFTLVGKVKAAHGRVLWGVSWSHDDALLVTGARDNLVKLWRTGMGGKGASAPVSLDAQLQQPALVLPPFAAPVTAVAFAEAPGPAAVDDACKTYWLAVGLESGQVQLWQVSATEALAGQASPLTASCVWQSDKYHSHAAQVNTISWRGQGQAGAEGAPQQFVSCSDDHSIRVFSLRK